MAGHGVNRRAHESIKVCVLPHRCQLIACLCQHATRAVHSGRWSKAWQTVRLSATSVGALTDAHISSDRLSNSLPAVPRAHAFLVPVARARRTPMC